ncbi:MAG: ATP synthase subunit I [Clostridia bacterium]|nr:ATP synthase subunit I [Clostridia bacterium]
MAGMNPTVRRELGWVTLWTLGLSALMNGIFLLLGKWEMRVLWGTALGCAAAIGNFLLMCLTVEKAVGQEPARAKATVASSQTLRLLMQGAVLVLAFTVKVFHPLAALLPLLFPQLAIRLRPLWKKGMAPGQRTNDQTETGGGDALD